MSKFYIGGVANVDAFTYEGSTKNPQHLFSAKTLTDSSINISVSNEEIRGGEGAQLLGKFFHTTVFNLSLTDALFDLNYIARQVGVGSYEQDGDPDKSIVDGDTVTMKSYTATISGNVGTVSLDSGEEASPLSFGNMYESDKLICWDANGKTYTLTETETAGTYNFNIQNTAGIESLCVTVPISKEGKQLQVNAMYYPGMFSLVMRARLFMGDACQVSNGQPVGELVIEIPKFQLDGTIDLAMAMTSPATYSLNGSALANGCGCADNPWYAKITEVIFDATSTSDEFAGYTDIVVDEDFITVGNTLAVYAFASNKMPKRLTPSQYTVSPDEKVNASTGLIEANGAVTIAANVADSDISDASTTVVLLAGE